MKNSSLSFLFCLCLAPVFFLAHSAACADTEGGAYPDVNLQLLIGKMGRENLVLSVDDRGKSGPELIRLGRELFFSKSLSGELDVACASCHHPFLAGGDGLSLPVGVEAYRPSLLGPGRWHDWTASLEPRADGGPNVARNSPTTINADLYKDALFHDGRVFVMPDVELADSERPYYRTPDSHLGRFDPLAGSTLLEAQTRFPLVSVEEMRGNLFARDGDNDAVRTSLVARLRGDTGALENSLWPALFQSAFGDTNPNPKAAINFERIQKAIAAYQASQIAVDSPWQRYLKGELAALDTKAQYGAWLFLSPVSEGGAGCSACHKPPFFTDESYHNIAVPQFGRGKNADSSDYGRYQVTRNPKDRYRFRTPSLVNVEMTGPYGHTGAFVTLRAMIEHHIDPRTSIAKYDYSFADNPQLASISQLYSNSQDLSQEVLSSLLLAQASGQSALPFGLSLKDWQLDALESFLTSLTDPCLKNRQCLAKWIPAADEPAPDKHRLVAEFAPAVDTLLPPVPVRERALGDMSEEESGMARESVGGYGSIETVQVAARIVESSSCQAPPAARHGAPAYGGSPVVAPGPGDKAPLFKELGQSLGLTQGHRIPWQHYSLRTAQRLLFTGGVAAADINGDCLLDLFFPTGNSGAGILYLNTGDRYVDASAEWGLDGLLLPHRNAITNGAAFADLDGDADMDLLVSLVSSDIDIAVVEAPAPNSRDSSMVMILLNEGDSFRQLSHTGIQTSLTTWSFGLADVDADGDLDVMTSHWRGPGIGGSQPNHLWINTLRDGALGFDAADEPFGLITMIGQTDFTFTPTFSDAGGDGLPDLLLAADFESSQYYRNTGRGFFRATHRSEISDENGMGSAVGDYDNDGDMDWFVSSIWDPNGRAEGNWGVTGNKLYQNTGGRFNDATAGAGVAQGYWGWGACFADFDGDMHLDLFQTSGFDLPVELARQFGHPAAYERLKRSMAEFERTPGLLFMSKGDGSFQEMAQASGITGMASGRGVLCLDYDSDGDIDILVSNHQGTPSLYRNDSRPANYLKIRLESPGQPNLHAVGAKVFVTAGGITQMREVQSGGGYLSGGPPELHFGLDDYRSVDQIRVRWPGPAGRESVFSSVAGNRSIVIQRE